MRLSLLSFFLIALVSGCQYVLPAGGASAPANQGAVASPARLTGSFAADARPSWMQYLSLTQTGPAVSGFLIVVRQAGSGTSSETHEVSGSAESDSFTIRTTRLGTMTGRREGQNLAVTFPNSSGQVATTIFTPTSEASFNQALADWNQRQRDAAAALARIWCTVAHSSFPVSVTIVGENAQTWCSQIENGKELVGGFRGTFGRVSNPSSVDAASAI